MMKRSRDHIFSLLLAASFLAASPPATAATDPPWPGFRGPDAVPVSDNDRLPLHWSTTRNVEWKAGVPGLGWSSPIIAGGKVFVTTATSETPMKRPEKGTDFSNVYRAQLVEDGKSSQEAWDIGAVRDMEYPSEITVDYLLLAYDLETGKELWRRDFFHGPPPGGRNRKNSYASETPVTDGETVYIHVGNLGLWAYSLDGELRWQRRLDAFLMFGEFGTGGSPALTDDQVIVLNDNEKNQFIAGFSKKDGREVWRTARDIGAPVGVPGRSGWTTPFVWHSRERTEIVAQGSYTVISYDTKGRELWRMEKNSWLPAPSPFAYDGHLFLTSGVHGDKYRPITAIRPGASGDLTLDDGAREGEHIRWSDPRAGTYIPTPVPYRGSLWVLYDRGILGRYDAATGKRIFRGRIEGSAGAFSASPWAYRGKVFATDEDGTTFVFEAGNEFEQLHTNPLDEMVLASPAMAGDRLIIRTKTKLYSFKAP